MGYDTEFSGFLTITPEIKFRDAVIINNLEVLDDLDARGIEVPDKFTNLSYVQWTIDDDGKLVWDGTEKFYDYQEILQGLIEIFFAPRGYKLNGTIAYQGEEIGDTGNIIVKDNQTNNWQTCSAEDLVNLDDLLQIFMKNKKTFIYSNVEVKKIKQSKDLVVYQLKDKDKQDWQITFTKEKITASEIS